MNTILAVLLILLAYATGWLRGAAARDDLPRD